MPTASMKAVSYFDELVPCRVIVWLPADTANVPDAYDPYVVPDGEIVPTTVPSTSTCTDWSEGKFSRWAASKVSW